VRLIIRHPSSAIYVRHISRDLLRQGLWAKWDGEGISVSSDAEWFTLQLAVSGSHGAASVTVQIERKALENALGDIHFLVPIGLEQDYMNWSDVMRGWGEAA
jgi:hypothetical protein